MGVVGKILRFVWKNRSWLIPVATEGYKFCKIQYLKIKSKWKKKKN